MDPKQQAPKSHRGNILVGPAGWSYSDWHGIVYPSKRPPHFHEAAYLSRFFDAIEINTSFYNPLRADVAMQWVDRVASNPRFQFTAKLWHRFTHELAGSPDDERAVRRGFEVLREANRLGAVLLQFPFSFHHSPESFAHLKQICDAFRDYPLVVEVRHSSWVVPEFFAYLRGRHIGFCNVDQPLIGRSVKPGERATSGVGYVRLHGRRYDTWFSDDPTIDSHERYNYLYSPDELEPWVKRIHHVAAEAHNTFVITNNHFEGKSIVNALQLMHMLSGEKVVVPEELRHHYPQLEAIASEPSAEPTLFPLPPP